MFGKDETIQSILPAYKIEALVRKENLDRWDDRLTLRTNLIESYQALMDFIRKHLSNKFFLDGDRRLDLRELIFREIIANIIIHREYTNPLSTELIIYNEKVETSNPNKPHLRGPLLLESFSPFPKNPLLRKLFSEMGWADEIGSGVKNVNKYLKHYTSPTAEPLFFEDDVFRTTVPLIVFSLSEKVDYLIELFALKAENLEQHLIKVFQNIEIPLLLTLPKEKHHFIQALVSNWIKAANRLPGLRIEDADFADPAIFTADLNNKGTRLLGKRFFTLMKCLLRTVDPVTMDDLMIFMEYKNKKSFRELYLKPLMKHELVQRTIPDKPRAPNQQYKITKRGELFLGGFEI